MRHRILLTALVLSVTFLCYYVVNMRGPTLIENPYVDGDVQSSERNFLASSPRRPHGPSNPAVFDRTTP